MGTFNSAVLPASTGLNLGSATQSWNVFANTLTVGSTTTFTSVTSGSANPASTGKIQLASIDAINFRNNANSADVNGLSKNASDYVLVGGTAGVQLGGPLQSNLRAGASGQVNLLNYQHDLNVAGTGAEATVYTYTLPANTVLASQGISVRICWGHTVGSASVAYKVYFGATVIDSWSSTDTAFNIYEAEIFNELTNDQNVNTWKSLNGTFTTNFPACAVDTTAGVIIKFTMNVAATDTVQGDAFRVLLLN